MQSDKLNKNAPAHPTNAPQPATAIPHAEVSLKQSDVQKQTSAPTQVKQGNTVTLTQGGVDNSNTTRHIAQEGTQPVKTAPPGQKSLTGGLDAVEIPPGMGAKS